jgi:hypothetical protein
VYSQISYSEEPFELALDISSSLILNSIYTPALFEKGDLTFSIEPVFLSLREAPYLQGDKHAGFGLGVSLNYCITDFLYLNSSYSGLFMNSNFTGYNASIDGHHFFNSFHLGLGIDTLTLAERIAQRLTRRGNVQFIILNRIHMPFMAGVFGTLYSTEYDEVGSSFNNKIGGKGFIFGISLAQVIVINTNIGNVSLNFLPYIKYLFMFYNASNIELSVEEDDGTVTSLYNSEDDFTDVFKFQFGTDITLRTERGWSFSIGLIGLLGGVIPVYGKDTYMFLASVTFAYSFNRRREVEGIGRRL